MKMITVGLDFGTHQTKICIEEKEGAECHYRFHQFVDQYGRKSYTLPSVLNIAPDGLITYGFLRPTTKGTIKRYFKQSAFRMGQSHQRPVEDSEAMLYSAWYIAYILFDLEELYGQNFTIQMGVPTSSKHHHETRATAIRILSAAYKLVEEVFDNDKEKFLATDIRQLQQQTVFESDSAQMQKEYGMLVFPEAYACLMPLTSREKIAKGMNMMIDIGGGTTDISFFNIDPKTNRPQIYDFVSLGYGLNFLTRAEEKNGILRFDSNVESASEIDPSRRATYFKKLEEICDDHRKTMRREWLRQTSMREGVFHEFMKNRPIIYNGGGSTFNSLRKSYGGYCDMALISQSEWNTKAIQNMREISENRMCPILSIAYGLSISVPNDDIKLTPLEKVFSHMSDAHRYNPSLSRFSNHNNERYDYGGGGDQDTWK